MNLGDVLAATAERVPERTALIYRDRQVTFSELDTEASRLAASLLHLGVEVGDRVALWLPNHPAFIAAIYGAWRIGAILVPINPLFTFREALHLVSDSGARALVTADPFYGDFAEDLRLQSPELHHVILVGDEPRSGDLSYGELLEPQTGVFPAVEVPSDHLALLAYTSSDAAGRAKGAMLTHGNLYANLEQMRQLLAGELDTQITVGMLPFSHLFGLNVVQNLSIARGATIALLERFEPAAALTAIRELRVTEIIAAPPTYVGWLHLPDADARDFASVSLAVSGAAPLPPDVLTRFHARFGITIREGYGLTEAGPAVAVCRPDGVVKAGSVGTPLPGVETRLVTEAGQQAVPGEPGELLVRGPNVFRGYWQHPDDTDHALHDGWMKTGDLARFDADGDLFIVGRIKDMILVSGFKVYPTEVEDVLASHHKVSDCAVVGVPDPYSGEHVRASVVAEPDLEVTEEELVAYCQRLLAAFKVPAAIQFVHEIPRSADGMVLRRELA